ncbi:MAG TPA: hypothetical protein VGV41_01165 [Pseudolabrys sp.]|uniref:hypothetical protein n=1 Tax=Pseudolabrys sp. TaxID=1960880 RepID=UPI002DDD8E5B|nr:hypothetical protein [Pseudolabrys sp.]HEV2627241.1 hypothetical protein [Pseudolabrys sp.]
MSRQDELAEQFCDVPTNNESGAFICYADVLQWVSEYLSVGGGWPREAAQTVERADAQLTAEKEADRWHAWEVEARHQISRLCQIEKLHAFGLTPTGRVEKLPGEAWANLYINELDGQPLDDQERYGSRPYGEAWWRDTEDADRLTDRAWTGVRFRKTDILKFWPHLKKATRGRPLTYNWEGVKRGLVSYRQKNGDVQSRNELLHLCSEYATELNRERRTPDDATIRDAIRVHKLDRAAGLMPGK